MATERTPQRLLYEANCNAKRATGSAVLALVELAGYGAAAIADKPTLVRIVVDAAVVTVVTCIGSLVASIEKEDAAKELVEDGSNTMLFVPERHFITRRNLYTTPQLA